MKKQTIAAYIKAIIKFMNNISVSNLEEKSMQKVEMELKVPEQGMWDFRMSVIARYESDTESNFKMVREYFKEYKKTRGI